MTPQSSPPRLICPRCGRPLQGTDCASCGTVAREVEGVISFREKGERPLIYGRPSEATLLDALRGPHDHPVRRLLRLARERNRRLEGSLPGDAVISLSVVHGNFHPGNVRVTRDGRVAGFIGWRLARAEWPTALHEPHAHAGENSPAGGDARAAMPPAIEKALDDIRALRLWLETATLAT